jgi:hypothetical protein
MNQCAIIESSYSLTHVIAGEESGDSLVGVALLTEVVSFFDTVDAGAVVVFALFSTAEDDRRN